MGFAGAVTGHRHFEWLSSSATGLGEDVVSKGSGIRQLMFMVSFLLSDAVIAWTMENKGCGSGLGPLTIP